MSQAGKTPSKLHATGAYAVLAVLSAIYIGMTLWNPIDQATRTYSLSPRAIHSLELTIILPVIAIWFIALWGSLRFRKYALSIYHSADGRALKEVANGLIVLISGLALTSVLQSFNQRMIGWGHIKAWTIFGEYVAVLVALAALLLIARGAWRLGAIVQFRNFRRFNLLALVVLAVIAIGYVWALAHDPYRTSSPNPAKYSSFYLPDWVILLTLVLPYILVWYCGLFAAACLWIYQTYSSGIIYRKALIRASVGLLVVISASILIQLLDAISSSLAHLGLRDVLFVLYGLIIIYAAGHVLIASGARKLARIEEVDGT